MKKVICLGSMLLGCALSPSIAKTYEFSELRMMINEKKSFPKTEEPKLSSFDSFEMPYKECRKGAQTIIDNVAPMYPVIIDSDDEAQQTFKARVWDNHELFILECIDGGQKVFRAKYK